MQNFNLNVNPLNLSNPMQQIMELNQKTLKKFSYIEPQELTQIRDPKALLEKNMEVFIDNGHKSLDYMYELFNILENSWINISNEAGKKTKDLMQHTQSAANSAMNKMSSGKSKTAHPQSPSRSPKMRATRSSPQTSRTHTSREESPKSAMSVSYSSGKKDDTQKIEKLSSNNN